MAAPLPTTEAIAPTTEEIAPTFFDSNHQSYLAIRDEFYQERGLEVYDIPEEIEEDIEEMLMEEEDPFVDRVHHFTCLVNEVPLRDLDIPRASIGDDLDSYRYRLSGFEQSEDNPIVEMAVMERDAIQIQIQDIRRREGEFFTEADRAEHFALLIQQIRDNRPDIFQVWDMYFYFHHSNFASFAAYINLFFRDLPIMEARLAAKVIRIQRRWTRHVSESITEATGAIEVYVPPEIIRIIAEY